MARGLCYRASPAVTLSRRRDVTRIPDSTLPAPDAEPGPVARAALALTDWAERWLPDAFIFALLATFIVVAAAVAATPSTLAEVVDAWGGGFWELIPFTLQMSLI